jgi:hypothetical protein
MRRRTFNAAEPGDRARAQTRERTSVENSNKALKPAEIETRQFDK